ncbi:response regulator [Aquabacter sp. L1I39]|uniref:response regulator n=1 Tax=Aquabacter sp. L1I39 TaxID=2820278 RepID=UPI001ADABF74|nr:response regulator [Aquabacter sp. L1I39]QTL05457.1 response regulator [Aquabacter sp. L1I39]
MSELLIVDDEPEFLDELLEAFAFNGVVARSADSAGAALALLEANPDIRVVVSDIRMPDMDGLVMIDTAKQRYPARDLTFVVMTGHAATADLDRARAAGVRHCFPKPLSFEDLQGAIEEALAEK